jgi:hypothetical protein
MTHEHSSRVMTPSRTTIPICVVWVKTASGSALSHRRRRLLQRQLCFEALSIA